MPSCRRLGAPAVSSRLRSERRQPVVRARENAEHWPKPLCSIRVARPSEASYQGLAGKPPFALTWSADVLLCERMERLLAARSISQKGAHHDIPSATHDRRHRGAESRPEYTNIVSATGLPVRTTLPQIPGPVRARRDSYLPGQVHLANERKLAPSSILIAVSALRFLYKVSLKREWPFDEIIPAPKKPQKLPVVLSPEEVLHLLECVGSMKHRAILTTC